ncbi:nucleotide exchange factor GrpE [Patescibacteria group bacterium]|nr:nucleotide exchange factor GrpE [Patescibacteria group bacterium]
MDNDIKKEGDGQERPETELEKVQKERDEYLDGWKRAKADFINYKKDEAARLEQFVKFSNESLLSELVMVLDSFDLSLTAIKDEATQKGVLLIKSQLEDLLKKYGLERIKVKEGDAFDPGRDEAVGEVEAQAPPGHIAEVIAAGYTLHGKVIRATRVKLSRIQNKE